MNFILPEFVMPSDDDFKPLIDAATVYSNASVATSSKYVELMKTMHYTVAGNHADLKPLKNVENEAYRTMTDTKNALEDRFPGLKLQCPAPWVGRGGDVSSYDRPIYWSRRYFAEEKWLQANAEVSNELHKMIRALKYAKDFRTGLHYMDRIEMCIWKIGKITHHGKRIHANSIFSGKPRLFRPENAKSTYRIPLRLVKIALDMFRSQQANLQRFGLESHDPPTLEAVA